MQFKVPQNVYIEDKILPFMTMRQLIISGVGGGFTYMIYLSLEHQSPEIWIPPVVLLGAITVAVAFLKIHDIPFVKYILLVIERYLNETKRTWIKSSGDIFLSSGSPSKKKELKKAEEKSTKTKEKTTIKDVDKLSKMLDEG